MERFVEAAKERRNHTVRYDPTYIYLEYPGGDAPPDTGVCTDEVIRAHRALGIDLQKLVHEDMKGAFSEYPRLRGLKRHDSNIDHRRLPNPETFFRRHGAEVEEGSGFSRATSSPGTSMATAPGTSAWSWHRTPSSTTSGPVPSGPPASAC